MRILNRGPPSNSPKKAFDSEFWTSDYPMSYISLLLVIIHIAVNFILHIPARLGLSKIKSRFIAIHPQLTCIHHCALYMNIDTEIPTTAPSCTCNTDVRCSFLCTLFASRLNSRTRRLMWLRSLFRSDSSANILREFSIRCRWWCRLSSSFCALGPGFYKKK